MSTQLRSKLAQYLKADNDFQAIFDYTKRRFEAAPELTAHNWEHAYRDVINSIEIGEAEGADMTIVLPAAVMHDIGFLYGAAGEAHGRIGSERLAEYLADAGIELDAEKLAAIAACIRTHKGSAHDESPELLEAKVVSDADLLEKLGPVGVYQLIRTYTEFNWNIKKAIAGIGNVDRRRPITVTGQRLAEERKQYAVDFAADLEQAYEPYATDDQETTA